MNMSEWTTSATYFPWLHVQEYFNRIDSVVYRDAINMAHELHLIGASGCPRCSRAPADLTWFSITAPVAEWRVGNGRVGFITICPDCQLQVDFLVDDELTELEQENFKHFGTIE